MNNLVWTIIPLVLIGIVGMQDADATWKSSHNYTENWNLGEGLKKGDYFSYSLCHIDYKDCTEFEIDIWIKGDTQVDSETRWLAKVVVYDGNEVIQGGVELGKIQAEPIGDSKELGVYLNIFKSSISWLTDFEFDYENADKKKIVKSSHVKNMNIGTSYPPLKVETVTVPAGTWESIVVSWKQNGYTSNIWIADGFPFPIRANTLTYPSEGIPPTEYKFELLNYHENILEDPFHPSVHPEESFAKQSKTILNPKEQLESGVAPEDVICKEELNPYIVGHQNRKTTTLCITDETMKILEDRKQFEFVYSMSGSRCFDPTFLDKLSFDKQEDYDKFSQLDFEFISQCTAKKYIQNNLDKKYIIIGEMIQTTYSSAHMLPPIILQAFDVTLKNITDSSSDSERYRLWISIDEIDNVKPWKFKQAEVWDINQGWKEVSAPYSIQNEGNP